MKKEYFEILLEEMNGKFDLVLEGHSVLRHEIQDLSRKTDERFELVDLKFEALNDKIDSVDQRLSDKIDSVAAELKEHRADTEAHHGIYRVGERP